MAKGRVLLVEPQGDKRLVYGEVLRKLAGCERVDEADSPEKAQDYLRRKPIDLLVTHVHFYKENGDRDFERAASFCRHAREVVRKDLPIIGLSSIDFGPTQKKRYGFPDDLRPFHVDYDRTDKLLEMVRSVLHGPNATDTQDNPGATRPAL
jgi:CheY-like chemotaxis protein